MISSQLTEDGKPPVWNTTAFYFSPPILATSFRWALLTDIDEVLFVECLKLPLRSCPLPWPLVAQTSSRVVKKIVRTWLAWPGVCHVNRAGSWANQRHVCHWLDTLVKLVSQWLLIQASASNLLHLAPCSACSLHRSGWRLAQQICIACRWGTQEVLHVCRHISSTPHLCMNFKGIN